MTDHTNDAVALSRRRFLVQCPLGLGAIGLASLVDRDRFATTNTERGALRFAPRAKSVIYLHMAGSPPQHDTFDPKPELQKNDGKLCPKEFIEGKRLAFIKGHPKLLASPHEFHRVGQSGRLVTKLMPHFADIVDKVCMVRSMWTDEFNHAPAQLLLYTGSPRFGAASMGAWASYGLGSINRNLPTFVVMVSGGTDPSGGKSLWGPGFLPPEHQATQVRAGRRNPVFFLENPPGLPRAQRRRSLETLRRLNEMEHDAFGDDATTARIRQYELAFRMQMSVPEVMDIAQESQEVLDLYGARPGEATFANNCLLARRLVENGTRFVQLFDWGWDIHGTAKHDDLVHMFPKKCLETDRPIAALIKDLERRGLLDETLVVWGGEFGRTAMLEARNGSPYLGRDHHPECFTMWMAGGGVKPGFVWGATDELGHTVVDGKMHVRDLQATILHQLGLDPHKFHYEYQGLRQRLIGPANWPKVNQSLLA